MSINQPRTGKVEVFVNADPEMHGFTTTDEVDHLILKMHEAIVRDLGFRNDQVNITARSDIFDKAYYIHSAGGAYLHETLVNTRRAVMGE